MVAEFRRVYRVQGMDTAASPRFQMVPDSGRRWVALHDGAGMTVTSSTPSICTVTEIREADVPRDDDRATGAGAAAAGDRFFRLEGNSRGMCTITAAGGPTLPVVLEVHVKGRFTQRVKFFSVSDNAGHHSTRPLAVVGQWIPTLNYIFGKQANIRFVRHGSLERITIPRNLGNPIQLPGAGGLGPDATAIANEGDITADLNVFFVWELRRAPAGDSTEATTQMIGSAHLAGATGNILIEDNVDGRDDLALAHEIGHHLGLHHNTANAINLMFDTSPLQGFALNKDEVNIANTL
jgi:hypothetical protein